MKQTAILAISMMLMATSADAKSKAVAHRFEPADPSIQVVTTPNVDQEAEVEIGQAMVRAEPLELRQAIRLKTRVESKSTFRIVVQPGVLPLQGRNAQGNFYQQVPRVELYTFGLFQPDADGGVFIPNDGRKPQLYWNSDYLRAITIEAEGVEYEPTTHRQASEKPLRRELVYSGISKGVVKVLYREFLGDMARPAFSQDLNYDLADGDEIGYRGARIKVIKATNTSIRFRVVRPLDVTQ